MADEQPYRVYFVAPGIDPNSVVVRKLSASEGLSRGYRVEVEVNHVPAEVGPAGWLLSSAQVVVARGDGTERIFGGIITSVKEHATATVDEGLVVTIEPPLALLKHAQDCRIYQHKTSQDIVTEVLEEASIGDVQWRVVGSYPAREVCIQYCESTLSFVNRILEEDGIFYFYEHTTDGTVLVFADADTGYAATAPHSEIAFRQQSGLSHSVSVTSLAEREQVRPRTVTLRDHDFKRPQLDLEASAETEVPLAIEYYDYPGRYVEPDEGARRAQVKLEAMTAEAVCASGESNCFSLTPGHHFALYDAADQALDGDWVVRDIEHRFRRSQEGAIRYHNAFVVLRKDAPYRPPARAARGCISGPQLARVTGPPGEEIHCDEFGRVKVHFPWDRHSPDDDTSSCWVRVSQMHSSGSVAIPRVGWEVLVDFEDGDPDKPLVVGRLYNGMFGPPYTLPDEMTKSSLKSASSPGGSGYNEIRMEDAAGGEHVHVHAQKDHNLNVANNKTEQVTTTADLAVGANHSMTVGADETVDVGKNDELTVGAAQSWDVGASRTKTVSGGEQIKIKGSRSTTIGGSHTTMTPMTYSVGTPASLSETVGGSCLEVAALEVGSAVAGAVSITVGGAKIEACVAGKGDFTLGARASTIGGALIQASGKDVATKVGGAKATTVGGVMAANAAGAFTIGSDGSVNINVGGAVAMNAATIAMKVGGSKVTIAAGGVVLKSSTIKLTATGPQPELAPIVADK